MVQAIGVADGDSVGDASGVDNDDGTETVPTSLGLIVTEGVGDGFGVAVETSIGEGVGVSDGLGTWAKVSAASKNALRPKTAMKTCFRMIGSVAYKMRKG